MTSTDSSDEENADLLLEAADHQFLNDSMFGSKSHEQTNGTESTQNETKLPSRRPREEEDNHNVLRVTPEFQKFVAKQLTKLIDSQLEEVCKPLQDSETAAKSEEGGVHLFRVSSVFLSCEEEAVKHDGIPRQKVTKRKLPEEDDEKDEDTRLSEAAVTADWVLSQEATKGWEPNTKGKVIVVKSSEIEIRSKKIKLVSNIDEDNNLPSAQNRSAVAESSESKEEAKKAKKKEKMKRRKERLKLEKEKAALIGPETKSGEDSSAELRKYNMPFIQVTGAESSANKEEAKKAKKKEKMRRRKERLKLEKEKTCVTVPQTRSVEDSSDLFSTQNGSTVTASNESKEKAKKQRKERR